MKFMGINKALTCLYSSPMGSFTRSQSGFFCWVLILLEVRSCWLNRIHRNPDIHRDAAKKPKQLMQHKSATQRKLNSQLLSCKHNYPAKIKLLLAATKHESNMTLVKELLIALIKHDRNIRSIVFRTYANFDT